MRFSASFFLVCWLAYFVVPMANSMGNSGEQRFQLCTTQGIQIYSATSDADLAQQPQPTNHSCPCTQYFLDTAESISLSFVAIGNTLQTFETLQALESETVHLPPSRGPPYATLFSSSRYTTS